MNAYFSSLTHSGMVKMVMDWGIENRGLERRNTSSAVTCNAFVARLCSATWELQDGNLRWANHAPRLAW